MKTERIVELLEEIQQDYIDCKDYYEALEEAIYAVRKVDGLERLWL